MLKGKKVYLRQPLIEDAKLWNKWLNDREIVLPLGDELYEKIIEKNIEKQIQEYANNNYYYMFTIVTNDGKPIGRCILFGINRVDSNGKVGIFLGEKDEWGKGYAKEALELLIEYSFRIQNLHSIMLGVFEFNHRAIELYKKIGFKEIGRRRDVRKINGKYVNAILMDILEDEYENKYLDFSVMH